MTFVECSSREAMQCAIDHQDLFTMWWKQACIPGCTQLNKDSTCWAHGPEWLAQNGWVFVWIGEEASPDISWCASSFDVCANFPVLSDY